MFENISPSLISFIMFVMNLLLGGGAVVAFIKIWPALKKIEAEREANILARDERSDSGLRDRVNKLEQQLEFERTQSDAEKSFMRHELNNFKQCFDSLVNMLEIAPEKVSEALAIIKEMRAKQEEQLAAEKGAMKGALLKNAMEGGNG